MDAELLKILCCPETHQSLSIAPASVIAALNEKIRAGELRNRAGETLGEPIESGLLREDRKVVYPVRGRMPILLIAEAVPVE